MRVVPKLYETIPGTTMIIMLKSGHQWTVIQTNRGILDGSYHIILINNHNNLWNYDNIAVKVNM
jgi:hypothetical protein